MSATLRRIFSGTTAPLLILAAGAVACFLIPTANGDALDAFLKILPWLPLGILAISAFMGIRLNNAGLFFSAALLSGGVLLYSPVSAAISITADPLSGSAAWIAISVFIDLYLFGFITRKRVFAAVNLWWLLLFSVQGVLAFTFFNGAIPFSARLIEMLSSTANRDLAGILQAAAVNASRLLAWRPFEEYNPYPASVILSFMLFGALAYRRLYRRRDPMFGGFPGASAAFFIARGIPFSDPGNPLFFSAAALILVVSTVERSISMAYRDDLTGLPARRSLNEALGNLGRKYAIAMVDVDHFKNFNDTYGHETGDQVLKMLASKFSALSGGGRPYRYGGEEFTAIFPGKSAAEAIPHLEAFRTSMESTPFLVRNKRSRKKGSENKRGTRSADTAGVTVTVSIGVAEPGPEASKARQVIKLADKALYKAKEEGRNRIATLAEG